MAKNNKKKVETKGKGKVGNNSIKKTKASLTSSKQDEKPTLSFKDPLSKQ